MKLDRTNCPACFSKKLKFLYQQNPIPAVNNLVYKKREEALKCKKDKVTLIFCRTCGFIFNSRFNRRLLKYKDNYDSYRGCSSTFRGYQKSLVDMLIKKYPIANKKILEIGCGQGEFLKALCSRAKARGIGVDPAYQGKEKVGRVKFIKKYFNPKFGCLESDICLLRHLLEHIEKPSAFLNLVTNKIQGKKELLFIIEGPDFAWISKEGSFWDITYEHCNYFSQESLRSLFKTCHFQVKDFFKVFSNQYLLTVAVSKGRKEKFKPQLAKNSLKLTSQFIKNTQTRWKRVLSLIEKMDSFTIWGMSGKGVILVNLLPKESLAKIPFVIDDNPRKQGKYCPGTGHRIVSSSFLRSRPVKNILVTNPIYYQEMTKKIKPFGKDFNLILV